MQVLGIDVADSLIDRWCDWLMPERQPFVIPKATANERGWRDQRSAMTFEVRDSFEIYAIPDDHAVVMLTAADVSVLSKQDLRAQPTRHRWPASAVEDGERGDRRHAIRYVEEGRRLSRHEEFREHWSTVTPVLPGAAAIAGTFPDRSGPNCFGAVMAAAGVDGAEREWMQREPFEAWLAEATRPGGVDTDAATVLVWRTANGAVDHAAVTLGHGFLLHKPSQGWMSPTKVLSVHDGKMSARMPGRYLSRRRIIDRDDR